MNNFFKKIRLNVSLFFHGLFRGLKSADETMLAQTSGEKNDGQEKTHRLEIDSVYNDLLKEHKTQQVMETIDMSYRVAREADKYEVTVIGDLSDESVGSGKELSAIAVKKVAMKYEKHPETFNERGYHVVLIQDNKKIRNTNSFSPEALIEAFNLDGEDYQTTLELRYDGFTPRFALEKYITKLVLRETKAGKKKIDLYVSSEAGQFTKKDAILIAELHRIMDNSLKKTDFLDILSINFTTDKAYGAEDYIWYNFTQIKYKKISIFDGSFVLTFEVGAVQTNDIVESHKTESLDKKYEEMAPKGNKLSIEDVGAIERRDKKLNKA